VRPPVVISGLAIDSLLGTSWEAVRANLRSGYTDFFIDPWLVERKARCPLRSGWFKKPSYDGEEYVAEHRTVLRNLSDEGLQGLRLLRPLLADARLGPEELHSSRTGVIGLPTLPYESLAGAHAAVFRADDPKPLRSLGSSAIQKTQLSGLANAVSIIIRSRGLCLTLETACSSAGYALAVAKTLIASGQQDRILIICATTGHYLSATFDPLHALSRRISEPHRASRPFDRGRDGVVPGGGMAAAVVESRAAAEKRGAPIYCEIAGAAIGSDGHQWTNPSAAGSVEAMQAALADAGMTVDDLGYVNAHATSTPGGDLLEARAIAKVLAGRPVPVTSTKSQEGHLGMATALTELYYSIVMMREGFIAPSINIDELDPELPPLSVVTRLEERPFDAFLKSSFGFGGTNACIVSRKVS
jgi:3-oxoacyl-[acyl-carrier-protein] synthase-1